MKHPKPLKAYETRYSGTFIQDANGEHVCSIVDHETALEIVSAVNGREKLVEALKLASNLVEYIDTKCTTDSWLAGLTFSASTGIKKALSEGGAP